MALTLGLHFDHFVVIGLLQVLPLDMFMGYLMVYLLPLHIQADESFRKLVQILKLFINTTMPYPLRVFL